MYPYILRDTARAPAKAVYFKCSLCPLDLGSEHVKLQLGRPHIIFCPSKQSSVLGLTMPDIRQ